MIEFEKVQMIRKSAKTTLALCDECGREADFVGLSVAAQLFDTPDRNLAIFINTNAVHTDEYFGICIPSLLAVMHSRQIGGQRLIGAGQNEI